MNKKELFEDLVNNHKSAGRVMFRPILMHFAARYFGKTYADFASDYKVLVESNIKAMEDFDFDMIGLLSDPYRETQAFGASIEYIPESVPKCLDILVQTLGDVETLENPNVFEKERTLDRIKAAEYANELLKGEVPVIGWVEGPLAEACDLAGVETMLLKLMMEPDFANILMDKCVVTAKEFAKAQIDVGCKIIGMGDAICSQIDLMTYETYVKNRQKEIIDYIHDMGAKVKLHICGDINHLIPSVKDLQVDILDCDWQVDLDKAFNILGNETIRCGNIDPVVIQDSTPGELFEMTKKLVEKEQNRPFILSGGCEITVNTPHENLEAMRKASMLN
jgi:MtaA/CmuA family methyltransferase